MRFGRSGRHDASLVRLARALIETDVDQVVITGNVTDDGQMGQWCAFTKAFEPLLIHKRVHIVPGDRDRRGHGVAAWMIQDRISVSAGRGTHVIRIDGPWAKPRWVSTPGTAMSYGDAAILGRALAHAPSDALVIVAMYRPRSLRWHERLADWVGWVGSSEEHELVRSLWGRCDIVLHGHEFGAMAPRRVEAPDGERSTLLYGPLPRELGPRARMLSYASGRLLPETWSLSCDATTGILKTPQLKPGRPQTGLQLGYSD